MANIVTRHIPNAITCMNLFSGCLSCVMAFRYEYDMALLFIVMSAVFDFFDGMAARALGAFSVIGKDIDSLADDISFGLAPSVIVFSLLTEKIAVCGNGCAITDILPYLAFMIAVFSALRLAKFNNDTRQTSSFIGLAVPANALFWASAVYSFHEALLSESFHIVFLFIAIAVSCWLLVSEIPMFSLKFKSLRWKDNKVKFIFIAGTLLIAAFLQVECIMFVIVWYILLSIINNFCTSPKSSQS